MKYLLSCLLALSASIYAQMPGFDIYVGDLTVNNNLLEVSNIRAITKRPEYDNQPYFLPDGLSLLYTSARLKDGVEQTDSIWVSLTTGEKINLTDSAVSEYSPSLMPNGQGFSVIWAKGEQQKLWRYPLDLNNAKGLPPNELLHDVHPVGYQSWIDKDNVLLFVLGEPHTLQLANIRNQKSQILDNDIGASLYAIPGTKLMSYTSSFGIADNLQWKLKSYNPETGQSKSLAVLPKGAYYYGWSADGKAMVAVGSQLKQWDRRKPGAVWQTFSDLSDTCPKGITRLTTNLQNSKIAFVCTL